MLPRVAELTRTLGLVPHPEGGHFREVFRSAVSVGPMDGRPQRAALTTIYFLLTCGERSLWHGVRSDEIWHFYEGEELELLVADPSCTNLTRQRLGRLDEGGGVAPVHVVPAGAWQAARSTGAYTLVGCTVGPGFDFADFTMLRDCPESAARMRQQHPELADLV